MTTTTLEQQRKKFEDWYAAEALPCESNWFKLDADDGSYWHTETNAAWLGWQAAIAALPLPVMPLQELTDEDITKLALDAGFQKHPLNGELVTMHRNGSWVDITSRLSNFADLVIAENYVPVMPEQAEPVAYINEDTLEWMKEIGAKLHTKMQLAFSTYPFQKNTLPLFSQDPSALLARVAELEAENAKLKEPVSQWIKCSDRMPEEDTWVIFYMHTWALGHRLQIAKKRDQWITMQNTMSYVLSEVTHWMPLPELPKD